MPFEPLRTDEKREGSAPTKKDFESQLMQGCGVIVVLSFLILLMTSWPYFAFKEYTVKGLQSIVAFGCIPATLLGIIALRAFRTAGMSGFLGGGMAAAAFMFLRLQQTILNNYDKDLPHTEYGDQILWLVPVGWLVWSALICLFFLKREDPEHENGGELSR